MFGVGLPEIFDKLPYIVGIGIGIAIIFLLYKIYKKK